MTNQQIEKAGWTPHPLFPKHTWKRGIYHMHKWKSGEIWINKLEGRGENKTYSRIYAGQIPSPENLKQIMKWLSIS